MTSEEQDDEILYDQKSHKTLFSEQGKVGIPAKKLFRVQLPEDQWQVIAFDPNLKLRSVLDGVAKKFPGLDTTRYIPKTLDTFEEIPLDNTLAQINRDSITFFTEKIRAHPMAAKVARIDDPPLVWTFKDSKNNGTANNANTPSDQESSKRRTINFRRGSEPPKKLHTRSTPSNQKKFIKIQLPFDQWHVIEYKPKEKLKYVLERTCKKFPDIEFSKCVPLNPDDQSELSMESTLEELSLKEIHFLAKEGYSKKETVEWWTDPNKKHITRSKSADGARIKSLKSDTKYLRVQLPDRLQVVSVRDQETLGNVLERMCDSLPDVDYQKYVASNPNTGEEIPFSSTIRDVNLNLICFTQKKKKKGLTLLKHLTSSGGRKRRESKTRRLPQAAGSILAKHEDFVSTRTDAAPLDNASVFSVDPPVTQEIFLESVLPYICDGVYQNSDIHTHKSMARALINQTVKDKGLEVKDLSKGLSSGIVLIKFLESVTGYRLKYYHSKPESIPQCMENLLLVIDYLTQLKICPPDVNPKDLFHGKPAAVICLVFHALRKFENGKRRKNPENGDHQSNLTVRTRNGHVRDRKNSYQKEGNNPEGSTRERRANKKPTTTNSGSYKLDST